MIQMQTSLTVADNSGAKSVVMIMPIGGSTGKIARLGDKIKVTVKEASPDGTAKKGKVYNAVIVRTRKEVRRKDGTYIRFDENAAVLSKMTERRSEHAFSVRSPANCAKKTL